MENHNDQIPIVQESQVMVNSQPSAPRSHQMLFLVFGVVILLGFALTGYVLWGTQKPKSDLSDRAMLPGSVLSPDPEHTAQMFYEFEISSTTSNTEKPSSKQSKCINPYTTSNTEKQNPYCAQNMTQNITYEKATISGDSATVIAHHHYDSPKDLPIVLTLRKMNKKWKVDNITCPKM